VMAETLAFSPDGKKLMDYSSSRILHVWDVSSSKRLTQFNGKDDRESTFAATWSPDGKILATTGVDFTVRLLDAETGQSVKSFNVSSPVRSLRFSPDSRFLAGVNNSSCPEIWDVATGKSLVMKTGHRAPVLGLAFTGPGRVV